MRWTPRGRRALAIDPSTRGFGFAVFEGPDCLVDWGVKGARENKNARCLELVSSLIDEYSPEVIVVEDVSDRSCWRRARARKLVADILMLASRKNVSTAAIARRRLGQAFPELAVYTKHEGAVSLGERFPQLKPLVPPYRKPWMSEDYRTAIFDAVVFALAFFASRERRGGESRNVPPADSSLAA